MFVYANIKWRGFKNKGILLGLCHFIYDLFALTQTYVCNFCLVTKENWFPMFSNLSCRHGPSERDDGVRRD